MTEEKILPRYRMVDGFRISECISPECFRSGLRYKARKDDLFITTYPKSGTTWTQQIVSLIQSNGKSVRSMLELHNQSPFLELFGADVTERRVKPGSIKHHLPYHMTPMSVSAKYLNVVRNPKDTLVSYYYHTRNPAYVFCDGKFDDYFELFINGETDFGDYFDHVLSWYEHRNDQNVMLLTYEELSTENVASIKKIAKFMGDEYLISIENDATLLDDIQKYSSFDHMKKIFNGAFIPLSKLLDSGVDINQIPSGLRYCLEHIEKNALLSGSQMELHHIRKGIVGDWRNHFTDEQSNRMDEKIDARLKCTDLYNYWKSIECI